VIVDKLILTGDASKVESLRLQRAATEAEAKLADRKNKYMQDVSSEIAKIRGEIEQVNQQETQRRQQLVNLTIRAPMSGIVKNVRLTTLGGVLRAGEELLQIVPIEERAIIEARVLPRDIAYVRPGLVANIKFDANDFSIFGMVEGKVTYVGPDSIKDETQRSDVSGSTYYRVHVEISAFDTKDQAVKTTTGKNRGHTGNDLNCRYSNRNEIFSSVFAKNPAPLFLGILQ